MSRLLLLSNVLVLLASATASALEPPSLTVVWHDSSRIFPAVGLGLLGGEIEGLFRSNRLPVRFHAAEEGENLRRIPEPRVNVIVLPDDRRRFRVPPNAMAAALGERGEKYTIFVFVSRVRRTLGHEAESSPRQLVELSRALARVVAHEVVHVLAPERGHAEWGLMSRELERDDLLANLLELDEASLRLAKERIDRLGACPPGDQVASRRRGSGLW